MKKIIIEKYPHILHGGDYNPDQWQDYPEVLEQDMVLLQKANCNEMTLGIFAWSTLEPREGEFDFSFLDKAMDDIYNAGGRVILATPSGARPQWLAQKYPEVLRCDNKFVRQHYGVRHNHCYTSPIYREKIKIINTKLAERYKNHPALIAWHISNEYGGECYCPLCQEGFKEWLRNKYGTLENLNQQWWTKFWSHTYTDWSQIEPPSPIGETSVHGLTLDWKRFVAHQTTDFMSHEINCVKKFAPDIPVTTNLMPFYNLVDYRVLVKKLDFVSFDSYPEWRANGCDSDIKKAEYTAMAFDLNRSYLHKPFLLMESTPGNVNWFAFNKLKRPGMHELASLQAIAHGSDSVQYFQWRKSRGSAEMFHGAVVDHEGSENTRVFKDVASLGARLKNMDEIVGTITDSKVGIIFEWSNRWAIDDARGFILRDKKVLSTLQKYYSPLWKRGINTDIIGIEDDFSNYPFIIAPMLYSVSETLGNKLKEYVNNGGTLLCTYMTAMVNENDLCHLGGFPGAGLREVFGVWNEEIDTLYPDEKVDVVSDGVNYTAFDFCECLHLEGAISLAEYQSEFYKGTPAATVNLYGKGKAYYVAFRDNGDFCDSLIDNILRQNKIYSSFDGFLPYGVTAHSRTDGNNEYVFIENFNNSIIELTTQKIWENFENGATVQDCIELQPYQTLILKISRNNII